jgi:hypothetical protein
MYCTDEAYSRNKIGNRQFTWEKYHKIKALGLTIDNQGS